MQINDAGEKFEASADPLLEELCPIVAEIKLGDTVTVADLESILTNEKVFGVNLIEIGMADKVVALFNEMNKAPGAIRTTLHDTLEKIGE